MFKKLISFVLLFTFIFDANGRNYTFALSAGFSLRPPKAIINVEETPEKLDREISEEIRKIANNFKKQLYSLRQLLAEQNTYENLKENTDFFPMIEKMYRHNKKGKKSTLIALVGTPASGKTVLGPRLLNDLLQYLKLVPSEMRLIHHDDYLIERARRLGVADPELI